MKEINMTSTKSIELSKLDEVQISPPQYMKIMKLQRDVLHMLSLNQDYHRVLDELCHLAETLLPNSVASIMMLDKTTKVLDVLSAPSVPLSAIKSLNGLKPGSGGGSCGNAVYSNQATFVKNTFTDERWKDIRRIAIDFNICSCWSMPIRNENNEAIGSFALSSFEHRDPSSFHKLVLETSAKMTEVILKKHLQEIRENRNSQRLEIFAKAAENAVEGMIVTDENNKIIEVNSASCAIFGYSESEMIGQDPKLFASQKHRKTFYKKMWKALNTLGHWSGEMFNRRSDGRVFPQYSSISVIPATQDKAKHYVAVFTDIRELKNTQDRLEYIAYHDTLTSLYNSNKLHQKLKASSQRMSLIILNVDNFHYLNSVYGFDFGDKVLQEISVGLRSCRYTDEVYRVGADEFALLFYNVHQVKEIITSVQKKYLKEAIVIDDIHLKISFSYGVASGDEKLYEHATMALRRAKELGKNRYYIFDSSVDSVTKRQKQDFVEWSKKLYDALETSSIIPYFQGIRDNRNGKIYRFEVLARLGKGDEIYSPYHFLEPARISGLLPRMTKMIIDKSFAIMQHYSYDFSINISEDDLNSSYLIEYLREKSSLYSINPHRIILEILEGVSGTEEHIKQLMALKKEGYALAIDDFGAEHSNFGRLLELEVDYIKIDAKYIKDINTNLKSYEITKSIAYFAKNSNIKCIAEYVHNQDVQDKILELEIEFSQGFMFSEPSPIPKSDYINN